MCSLSHRLALGFAVLLMIVSPLGLLAQPTTATTGRAIVDRSTPTAGYQALIDAIDREDVDGVIASMLDPQDLTPQERRLMAQRLIVGSKLSWVARERWGRQGVQDVMRAANVPFFFKAEPARMSFRMVDGPPASRTPGATAAALLNIQDGPGGVMTCLDGQWRCDKSGGSAAELTLTLKDAPWRIAMLRRALDDFNAGKIKDEKALIGAMVPPITPPHPTTNPVDRSNPEDVPAAMQAALDACDADALVDCFTPDDPQDPQGPRASAQYNIARRKLDLALHQRFGQEQGDRLVSECVLDTKQAVMRFPNVQWSIDGDVARGIRDGVRYDPNLRMVRRDGKWRIEWPKPERRQRPTTEMAQMMKQRGMDLADRTRLINDILEHPEKYPDPGSIVDQLSIANGPDRRQDEVAARSRLAEEKQHLEQQARELAETADKLPPDERTEREIGLSLGRQLLAAESDPAGAALAAMYFTEGDANGAYARARARRVRATHNLMQAVGRQIGLNGEGLPRQFTLLDAADDWMMLSAVQWKAVQGGTAIGLLPEHIRDEQVWLPSLRKVGDEWKLDVSDETLGDPAAAAKRVEAEAKVIEHITEQVKTLKFKTYDQVIAALKAADVRGTGKPM